MNLKIKDLFSLQKGINPDYWTNAAIEARDFRAYQLSIMHNWLRTLTTLASLLIPLFFVLDIFMMPTNLLTRFAAYRGVSTSITILQMIVVYRTKPSSGSYAHGYLLTLQVGGVIALMTADLGGFTSSYYAGLNLVIIGVNLMMPWREYHTFINSLLILGMYVTINLAYNNATDFTALLNNLFFMGATAVLSMGINFVRYRLIYKEFSLLVDLENTRDDLEEKNEIIGERTRTLKGLLDVSGQGFLSFNSKFIISSEYSMECVNIFGRRIDDKLIDELLYDDVALRKDFKLGLGLYFQGKNKAEVIFEHLDARFTIGDKIVSAAYKAVSGDSVMMVLTDITEEIKFQEASRRENEKWRMLRKVITNKQPFALFDREARMLFADFINKEGEYAALLPAIHTLKGNAGFLGFTRTQEKAHELENSISNLSGLGEDKFPGEAVDELMYSFAEEMAEVTTTLGPSWRIDIDLIELPKSELTLIENYIKTYCPNPQIISVIEEHKKKSLAELMSRLPKIAEQVATREGKRLLPVTFIGGDISVVTTDYEELIDSFSHIIRNSVDHGIELPVEREQKGKNPAGTIGIEIEETPSELIFKFSDDGQGIQFDLVEKRARELGYLGVDEAPMSHDFLSIIFWENFSTSPGISTISGRGVGLSSVRAAVKKMGGKIKVKTWKDHGSIFTVIIPKNN